MIFYELRNACQSSPNCRTAARTVPILRSLAPQSGTVVPTLVAGFYHFLWAPLSTWNFLASCFPKFRGNFGVLHEASTIASKCTGALGLEIRRPYGNLRPMSSYSSNTASKASWTFPKASGAVSPSVNNSGRAGEVTVNPPSSCGSRTNAIL